MIEKQFQPSWQSIASKPSASRTAVRKKIRLTTGIVVWLAVFGLAWIFGRANLTEMSESTRELTRFLIQGRTQIAVEFEDESWVGVGDPVVIYDDNVGRIVGNVIKISPDDKGERKVGWTDEAVVEFYSAAPALREGDFLSFHETPESMEWMVQMMLPPQTRDRIAGLIVDAWSEHQNEIAEALEPILVKSFRDAADIIRAEFYKSIATRDQQIQLLADRYQVELVDKELIPLVQDEIWPIVQQEVQPLAMEIGEKIWQEASVWRFGWRIIYDRSPLPERHLVKKEFERFLEDHGIPVLESYLPQMLAVQQRLLKKLAANDKVQTVVSKAAKRVLRDPEFQKLATDVLRDVVIDNKRLTEVFRENWKSPEAQDALELTNNRLESTVTQIGQTLFGAPDTSITPEFARVLRNRILFKDERWLVLHSNKPQTGDLGPPRVLSVVSGETGTENPFFVPKESIR